MLVSHLRQGRNPRRIALPCWAEIKQTLFPDAQHLHVFLARGFSLESLSDYASLALPDHVGGPSTFPSTRGEPHTAVPDAFTLSPPGLIAIILFITAA